MLPILRLHVDLHAQEFDGLDHGFPDRDGVFPPSPGKVYLDTLADNLLPSINGNSELPAPLGSVPSESVVTARIVILHGAAEDNGRVVGCNQDPRVRVLEG